MRNLVNDRTKLFFYTLSFFLQAYEPTHASSLHDRNSSIFITKQLIESIKKDRMNNSYTSMVDNVVMEKYTLSKRTANDPYFYTDRREVITEIISMVLENPDKVIDEAAKTGVIKIYRNFNFNKDIAPLLVKEKKTSQNYRGPYLGETSQGPTNQVVVSLKIGNSKDTRGKSAQFITAYPVIK